MTTYTVTTAQNITAQAAKAGGDTYNINGGTLTIDCDSRYGLNQGATTGYLGPITVSSTLGGTLKIDGTKVRLVPFNTGSGNVPAAGTAITQGSVTSELLGVWSAINAAPTAAGAAMPASGFIKVRNVAGGAAVYASGALGGIAATSRGADIVGWIEVIGLETKALVIPRIGSMNIQGAWLYPFDTSGVEVKTTGAAGQTIQLPASVGNTFYFGCWVETAAGSGVYARWGNASDLVNANLATDERGRFCWISSSGLLRFGSDGTNTVGLLPAVGCRVRVPNILLGNTNSTVGFGANSLPSTTATTRYNWATTCAGAFTIDLANVGWGQASQAWYSVNWSNSTFVAPTSLVNPQTGPQISNIICSQRDVAAGDGFTIFGVSSYAPGSVIQDLLCFMQTCNTTFVSAFSSTMKNGVINRVRAHTAVVPTISGPTGNLTLNLTNSTADSNESIGGCQMGALTMFNSKLTNTKFCAWAYGVSATTPTTTIWTLGVLKDSVIDGLSWLLSTTNTCQPVSAFFNIAPQSSNVKFRNFGTPSVPLDLGVSHPTNAPFASGFQASFDSVSMQRCFTTAAVAASFSQYFANTTFNIENCTSLAASTISLQASNSYYRAIRGPTLPAAAPNVTGIHWGDFFTSDTAGSFNVFMTDAAATTTDQVALTAGTPKFNGGPGLLAQAIGDQVTWTMRYYAQGHTAFSGAPIMSGGTIGNYLVEFQADVNDGNGFSAWATASSANLTAVSINPVLGVKLALRITCTTTNAVAITGLRVPTTTTLVAQQAVAYPLDPVTISVTGLASGSRVKITRTDTSAVLANAPSVAGAFSITGDYIGVPLAVEARCATPPGPYYQPWTAVGTPTSAGLSLVALQVRDDQ